MKNSYNISRRDIDAAYKAVQRERSRASRDKETTADLTNRTMQLGSVALGAFGSGVLQARYGVTSVGPVPADLLAGIALLGLGYYTKPTKGSKNSMLSDSLTGLGLGAVASSATKFGAGVGANWRQSSGAATPAAFTAGVGNWDYGQAYGPAYAPPAMAAPYAYPGMTDQQAVDAFRRGIG